MRIATIDIGTNTVLLLVADGERGRLKAALERAVITRLGEGVDRTRTLAPTAVRRTNEALSEFGRELEGLGVDAVSVVGTSAMRDAAGGEEVRACVRQVFGVDVTVLTGPDEARLTFRGACSGLPIERCSAVFDIGGGSTEVVVGRSGGGDPPTLSYAESFDVGSVRLTERYVTSDPIHSQEWEALSHAAKEAFRNVPPLEDGAVPVGVAGTVTTLAAVAMAVDPYDGERVHGQRLGRETIRQVVRDLAAVRVEARRGVPGMHPKRADVIVAGGAIVLALLDHWNAPQVVVSDRGVRWGLAEEIAFGCR